MLKNRFIQKQLFKPLIVGMFLIPNLPTFANEDNKVLIYADRGGNFVERIQNLSQRIAHHFGLETGVITGHGQRDQVTNQLGLSYHLLTTNPTLEGTIDRNRYQVADGISFDYERLNNDGIRRLRHTIQDIRDHYKPNEKYITVYINPRPHLHGQFSAQLQRNLQEFENMSEGKVRLLIPAYTLIPAGKFGNHGRVRGVNPRHVIQFTHYLRDHHPNLKYRLIFGVRSPDNNELRQRFKQDLARFSTEASHHNELPFALYHGCNSDHYEVTRGMIDEIHDHYGQPWLQDNNESSSSSSSESNDTENDSSDTNDSDSDNDS